MVLDSFKWFWLAGHRLTSIEDCPRGLNCSCRVKDTRSTGLEGNEICWETAHFSILFPVPYLPRETKSCGSPFGVNRASGIVGSSRGRREVAPAAVHSPTKRMPVTKFIGALEAKS